MPPRWLCVLIVACWLLFTGWLFHDELLPRLLPGQPPPVLIDLTEEAKVKRVSTSWTVRQNEGFVCVLETRINHPRRDVYEMIADFSLSSPLSAAHVAAAAAPLRGPCDNPLACSIAAVAAGHVLSPLVAGENDRRHRLTVGPLDVSSLSSVYRVNGDGDLLSFEIRMTASPTAFGERLETEIGRIGGVFSVTTRGEVRGGRLRLTREWGSRRNGSPDEPYAELPIARGAAVVMPLHPPRRMRGVSPGQGWRAVLIDPFGSAFAAEPIVVKAKVRPSLEPLQRGRRGEADCLVIDYQGEGATISVWIDSADGSVLMQEATLEGTRWRMERR